MARPAKLTEEMKTEAAQRIVDGGITYEALAKELGVSKPCLIKNVSDRVNKLKAAANQIVATANALSLLPVNDRGSAINLAQTLLYMANNMASTSGKMSRASDRLASLVEKRVDTLEDIAQTGAGITTEDIQLTLGSIRMVNEASQTPLKMMDLAKESINNQKESVNTPTRIVVCAPE
jgi:transposase-like protein